MRQRTQGKMERITAFLSSLQYIAMHFREPPGEAQMVRTAYRNLLPEYSRGFGERKPISLREIEDWGIQHEKLRYLDNRWEAPPSAEKIHIAHATFRRQSTRSKVAAALTASGGSIASGEESVAEATASSSTTCPTTGFSPGANERLTPESQQSTVSFVMEKHMGPGDGALANRFAKNPGAERSLAKKLTWADEPVEDEDPDIIDLLDRATRLEESALAKMDRDMEKLRAKREERAQQARNRRATLFLCTQPPLEDRRLPAATNKPPKSPGNPSRRRSSEDNWDSDEEP